MHNLGSVLLRNKKRLIFQGSFFSENSSLEIKNFRHKQVHSFLQLTSNSFTLNHLFAFFINQYQLTVFRGVSLKIFKHIEVSEFPCQLSMLIIATSFR